jgi:hypothetical protein
MNARTDAYRHASARNQQKHTHTHTHTHIHIHTQTPQPVRDRVAVTWLYTTPALTLVTWLYTTPALTLRGRGQGVRVQAACVVA